MRRELSPTLLLAIAAALFVAPAIYLLTVSMLSQQGSLGGPMLSGTAEVVIWAAAGVSLAAPFAIRRILHSSERARQLLLILVVTLAASIFGLVLSFTTGRVAPVRVLSVVSMLGVLSWSYAYREVLPRGSA
jgi:drug/metabolite transporter (DMT)-like permease